MNPPSRAALRRRNRAARRALTTAEQRQHAHAVARQFAASRLLLCFERFAIYAASDGELDPSPIAQLLLAAHKVVALPAIESPRERLGDVAGVARRLGFYRYRSDTPLRRNRYGIEEPDARAAIPVAAAILDVALLPLVAFDDAGVRLGRGGGYYDATFALRHPRRRPLLIGLAHELQHHAQLPHRPWDVPLDAVITERAARGFTLRARRFIAANGIN